MTEPLFTDPLFVAPLTTRQDVQRRALTTVERVIEQMRLGAQAKLFTDRAGVLTLVGITVENLGEPKNGDELILKFDARPNMLTHYRQAIILRLDPLGRGGIPWTFFEGEVTADQEDPSTRFA